MPAGVLAVAAVLVWLGRPLPPSLAGLAVAGPYAVRGAIEAYRMAVRGEDRPKKAGEGAKRRGRGADAQQTLSVTVSIGLASPRKRRPSPPLVIQAADEALYAAKQAGRNRVVAAK
jgi:GGDEF domain-containing protein